MVVALQILTAVGYGVARGPLSEMTGRATRATYPGAAIASVMQQQWHAHVAGPLRFVAAETWLGGNIATHAGDDVKVLIDGDFELAPWARQADVEACGMLIALDMSRDSGDELPPRAIELLSKATWSVTTQLPWTTKAGGPLVTIDWGIIPPQSSCDMVKH